eukprot:scaffold168335_cov42-Prasinocladus_malaysianus.AAC.1
MTKYAGLMSYSVRHTYIHYQQANDCSLTSLQHSRLTILTASQFPRYSGSLSLEEARAALTWLASFHAFFWGSPAPSGLWDQGTFWHLDTRRDEFEDIALPELKAAGHKVRLNS